MDKNQKKKKIIIFSTIGIALLILIVLVIIGSKRDPVITVQTEKVQRRTITQIVSATGKIEPETKVKINAEVSGEIIDLPVREGQRVRKGQLLVRIKPDAYQAQFERAQANLAMAEANLRKAEADYKRIIELYSKKLISDAEKDIAEASYQSAKATYEQAFASVKEARETLLKTSIYSPMDGVVSQLLSEVGERVSGSTFMQGTEIMTVADLSRMEARVEVGENDVVLVSKGDTARIRIDAYPDREFVGIVSHIANTAKTRGTGTQDEVINFEVRILINTPEGIQLRTGMSMSADIETETHQDVTAVPIQCVTIRLPKKGEREEIREGDVQLDLGSKKNKENLQEVVFVVKNGIAKTCPVKRGISDNVYVELVGANDLEGQEVVVGPFKAINRDLQDGSRVKIDNKIQFRTGLSASK